MNKKALRKIINLIAITLSIFSVWSFNCKCNISFVNAEDVNKEGNEIYLHYYTYNGSYCKYENLNENKFNYDFLEKIYTIDVVLFEGDFFAPYINGKGYANYNHSLSDDAKTKLLNQNIEPYTNKQDFLVKKSGTYRINLSNKIDTFDDKNNFYKIWEEKDSSITYLSESIYTNDPKGDLNIFLVGEFDGAPFNTKQAKLRTFCFNKQNNKYELNVNLYNGDVFCPFIEEDDYIKTFNSPYWINKLKENHLSISPEGYFVCLQDGHYKLEISYFIEEALEKSFVWSKDVSSSIQYISESLFEYQIDGHKTMLLTGVIDGKTAEYNDINHILYYDAFYKQYKIRIHLQKDDHVQLRVVYKEGYVDCLVDDSWLNDNCKSMGISIESYEGKWHFKISHDGYYEFGIGGNIENLESFKECYRKHADSYIKYLGNKISTCYVLLGSKSSLIPNVYLDGPEVKQYGLHGFNIKPVKYVELNGEKEYGSFLKIDYDKSLTNKIVLTFSNGEKIEFEPSKSNCYVLGNNEYSKAIGKTCEFLSGLSECLTNKFIDGVLYGDYLCINVSQAKTIKKNYRSLSKEAKEILNDKVVISSINNDGSAKKIKYSVIDHYLSKLLEQNNKEQNNKISVYVFIGVSAISLILYFLYVYLRRKAW